MAASPQINDSSENSDDNSKQLAELLQFLQQKNIKVTSDFDGGLPHGSVSGAGPVDGFWRFFSDSKRTDNVIRLSIFACIVLISLAAATAAIFVLVSGGERDREGRAIASSILTTVVTTVLGVGAGAGFSSR
jgi:hypothetical protein